MKTIRERAGECCRNTHDHSRENDPHTICGITYQAERVLRELVEEIAVSLDELREGGAVGWGDAIRRRFLGPPSAGEIILSACAGYLNVNGERVAADILRRLNEAGLLKEGG